MRRQISGKRILITGASSGIGLALAQAAGAKGARIVATARGADRLAQAVDGMRRQGIDAHGVSGDVTIAADRRRMIDAAVARWGGLDILVNNAGTAAHGHFIDLDEAILRRIMEVNFFATAEMCRAALGVLADGDQPLIVNVASMAGRRGVPAWTEYSASKFAVCGFSEALRAELARFDASLLLVVPGLTASNFGGGLLARKGRLPADFQKGLPPAEVARQIVAAIERNKREVRIERDARLLLLLNRLAPWFIDWRMAKVVRRLYPAEIAELQARRSARAGRAA